MPRPFPVPTRSKRRSQRPAAPEASADLAAQLRLGAARREPSDRAALHRWGRRLGTDAREAGWLARRLGPLRAGVAIGDLRRFMTGDRERTALDVAPTPWLRITETQITRPLADFINEEGPRRAMAFLRALPCVGVDLPDTFDSGAASAEVPADPGRIDLLVTGRSGRRTYGAAVEVKIDHALHNPLGAYARVASESGLTIAGREEGRPTGSLIVLARTANAATLRRLGRNKGWRFVHWSGFLRRFERELANARDDDDFRAYRRLVWDRFL